MTGICFQSPQKAPLPTVSKRPFKARAYHFLHWREAQGGAVFWDRGGASSRRRLREQRLVESETDFQPVDSFLEERGSGSGARE